MATAAAPATGQRLTDRQHLNVLSDLFGVDLSADTASLPLDPKVDGFRNAAAALLPSDLRVEGYAALASSVVDKVDWLKQLARDGVCADFTDQCQAKFVAVMGRRLFRRPLAEAQAQRFAPIFLAVKKEGDPFPTAAALVVRAMLQSPEFLYRLEAGDRYTFTGQTANVHDLAHSWRPTAENGFDRSVTWLMGRLAYFLKAMDDPAFTLPEGGTLLDNTVVLAGTEVADPAPHSFVNNTFMLAGGGGLFKPGIHDYGNNGSEVDLYSTVSRALGIADNFGNPSFFTDYLTGLV